MNLYDDGLASTSHHRRPVTSREQPAEQGLVVEDVTSGWVGAIVRVEKSGGMHVVVLEDRHGATRTFRLGAGFWVDGEPVILVPPAVAPARSAPTRTASGSTVMEQSRARVARASRLWVEGRHDAELVEKIWGDDLRVEGVVVELLEGVDHLAEVLALFGPTPEARAGILVDHLLPGTKEQRLVDAVRRDYAPAAVLVVGHPFVDVWQAVRPARLGLTQWPTIPRDIEWKRGILDHLGWPHADQTDIAHGWARILGTVRTYADLEPALLGRVEELIDFVTAP